jgi:hypothetical protein
MPKRTKNLVTIDIQGAALPLGWQTFIDEYFNNGFNGTQAYMVAYPNAKKTTASVNSVGLLAKANIQEQIQYRLNAQGVTDDAIVAELWDCGKTYRGADTIGAAVQALTTLAKIKGLIKEGERSDKFFQTNYLVYAPMVKPENIKKVQDVIEGAGRIIE